MRTKELQTYKYLGVVLDNKLEWSANIEEVYRRGQSRLFSLRQLGSFSVCSDMMCKFYHTIIESPLFYAVVCWGSCTTDEDCRRLNKLVQKAGSVVGRRLDPLSAVVEHRMRRKLYSVLENNKHPLYSILAGQRSSCSERLISLRCRTARFRRSFVPTSIRLFNTDC